MEDIVAIVLAAGKGKRMKSDRPKVLHEILGKPMIDYLIELLEVLKIKRKIIVIGERGEEVKKCLSKYQGLEFVEQKLLLGTADAVRQASRLLKNFYGDILVMYGDTPLLTSRLIKRLINTHQNLHPAATLLITEVANPKGYGRIIRDEKGNILKIVEEKDATPHQKRIKEINPGTYCFKSPFLFSVLKRIRPNNVQKEFYLTDVIEMLSLKKLEIKGVKVENPIEVMGINTRKELSQAIKIMKIRTNYQLMSAGVTIIDPLTTFITPGTKIGKDTIIYPFTIISGNTKIGKECEIGPFCQVVSANIGNKVKIQSAFIQEVKISDEVLIGPFARIRPGTTIARGVKVGNFVEIKNSQIGNKSQMNHLSYLGDAMLGKRVNIGAGTIICNYDGVKKYQTVIEDEVFVGSNSTLVAPLRIKKGAYTAAGSTITKEVPSYSLGIAREKQKNIKEWVRRKRKLVPIKTRKE